MFRWDYKAGKDYEFVGYIEDKIKKEHYSPDVVIVRMKTEDKKFKAEICTKTLYNYIDKGLFLNISSKDLLIKRQDSKGSIKSNKEST